MDYINAALLGIIEGITEFLPISSTGHLIIAEQWLGARSELFNIVIQAGAILAVTFIYWRRLMDLLFAAPDRGGLGLTVVRYNVGGGDDPAAARKLPFRAAVPGYEPAPGRWDWSADANQRWVLAAAMRRGADHVQAFSNGPPYWMTLSGTTNSYLINGLKTQDVVSYSFTYWDTTKNYAVDTALQSYTMK